MVLALQAYMGVRGSTFAAASNVHALISPSFTSCITSHCDGCHNLAAIYTARGRVLWEAVVLTIDRCPTPAPRHPRGAHGPPFSFLPLELPWLSPECCDTQLEMLEPPDGHVATARVVLCARGDEVFREQRLGGGAAARTRVVGGELQPARRLAATGVVE